MSLNNKKRISEISKQLCRDLRKRSTPAEDMLWDVLRTKKLLNKKFYRQHPIFYDLEGKETFFIADFYNHEFGLIIELDGEYHKYRLIEDEHRTEILKMLGLKVMRFRNEEILKNIDSVISNIVVEMKTTHSL